VFLSLSWLYYTIKEQKGKHCFNVFSHSLSTSYDVPRDCSTGEGQLICLGHVKYSPRRGGAFISGAGHLTF